MSALADVLSALADFANRPATSHDLRAQPGEVFSNPALVGLMQFAHSVGSRTELDAVIAAVAPMIRTADPFRGATLALSCGSMVEWGGDPGIVFPHLLVELPRHLGLARRAHERGGTPGAVFDADPDAARAFAGLTFLLLPTMAVICRGMEFRIALRANAEVAEHIAVLRKINREADFVAQVLDYTDGMELLVLVPTERKGFRVALEAVASNAHLFSLLQAELIGGGHLEGEPLDEEIVALARGEATPTRQLFDHARFNFVTPVGLNADGSLDGLMSLISLPVEERPAGMQRFEGVPVVLIGPKVLASRSWGNEFFAWVHDALRSRAEVVEVLPPERVDEWLERIQKARR